MNRTVKANITILASLVLFSCSSCSSSSDEIDAELSIQNELTRTLTQNSLEVYGAAAGSAKKSQTIGIEIPLDRDGLQFWALCSGADGTALVTLNDEGPFEISCEENGSVHEVTSSPFVQGNQVFMSVSDTPDAATWSVAASLAPNG